MLGIDLHLHLDGAMPLPLIRRLAEERGLTEDRELMRRLAEERGLASGEIRVEDLVQAGTNCSNLQEFLACFRLIEEILKEPAALEEASCSLVETLAAQGLSYAEIRFNPFLYVSDRQSAEEVVATVLKGIAKGRARTGLFCGAILCALVHDTDKNNHTVLELAKSYRSEGIFGFDLAGPEGLVPMEHFRQLFAEASAAGLPFTIHAGECGDPQNIETAISFGARRIGHGTAAIQSPGTMDLLRREGVTLEMCITSNIQTCSVASLEEHPIRRFFDEGIRVTWNTDDMTVSDITLESEKDLLISHFGFSENELAIMETNAIEAAFAPEEWKKELSRQGSI